MRDPRAPHNGRNRRLLKREDEPAHKPSETDRADVTSERLPRVTHTLESRRGARGRVNLRYVRETNPWIAVKLRSSTPRRMHAGALLLSRTPTPFSREREMHPTWLTPLSLSTPGTTRASSPDHARKEYTQEYEHAIPYRGTTRSELPPGAYSRRLRRALPTTIARGGHVATCVALAEGVRGCSPRNPCATSLRGPQRRVVSALEASFLTVTSFLRPSSLVIACKGDH